MPSFTSNILNSCGLASTQHKQAELDHITKCKFISKVLTEVSFFYQNPETESFYWRKIATELTQDETLDRFAYGYNLSNERNTFGSVINHIKLTFYKLMLENDKTGNNTLIYPSYNHTDDHFESVKFRSHSVNDQYEYFLPEEIRSMIIGGIINQTTNKGKNFFEDSPICNDDGQVLSDYELRCKFGVLFSMEENNYRTSYMKIKINRLEVAFFKMISKLGLSSEVVPIYENGISCCMPLNKLISKQMYTISDEYMPQLASKLNEQIEFLIVVKKFSEARIRRRFGAVDRLETQPIILEVHLDLC